MNRAQLALLLAMALPGCGPKAPPAPAVDVATADPELPSADQLFVRQIDALGGEEALRTVTGYQAQGEVTVLGQGLVLATKMRAQAPANQETTIQMPGMSPIKEGVMEGVAWELNPMVGPRIKTGTEHNQAMRRADFYAILNWADWFPQRQTVGVTQFADQDSYEVALTTRDGDEIQMFFSVDSGLVLGIHETVVVDMGPVPVRQRTLEWKEIGGIQVPWRFVQTAGPISMEFAVLDWSWTTDDPGEWALPPDIQALVPPETP